MKAMRSLAAVSALAISLAGCGGGGSSALPSGFNANSGGTSPSLTVRNWGESMLQGATYVGPASNAHLSVNVLVHQQNAAGLAQYAQDVSNPASASFRQFLTPQDIANRFGATQSDYAAAAQYFVNSGLAVGGWPQRMMLTVSGEQTAMERAFGTTFALYKRNGQTFVAPKSTPHFSTALPVDAIGHIVAWRSKHAYMVAGPPHAGAGFANGYSPSVVRAALDFSGAYSKGYNGNGIVLGIIGTGPIDTTATGSGDVDLNALAAATNTTNVAHVTQVNVTTSGVTSGLTVTGGSSTPPPFPYSGDFQTPPPVTANCAGSLPACNPEDGEAQLDVQQASTLAPGASVHFYLAYNASDCSAVTFPNTCAAGTGQPFIGIDEGDAEIQQAIADNTADVISISYGGGESQQGWTCYSGCSGSTAQPYVGSYEQLEFAAMATEGMAVFVSSGDSGSAECLAAGNGYLDEQCVSYPSGDPNVTSVGGVTAVVDGFGNPESPFLAWGISTFSSGYGATGGSGGGTSELPIPAPAWQQSLAGATEREQPDVSMIGDPSTGVALVTNAQWGGGASDIGGTSVAAPQMAAMWADVLSACKATGTGICASGPSGHTYRLGNAAPYLYAIYNADAAGDGTYGSFTSHLPYANVFYDILYGDNQMQNPDSPSATPIPGFPAMTGYDEVTGVGVPYAGHLIQAITGVTVP